MDDGFGEKSVHYQLVPATQCEYALEQIRNIEKTGEKMQLTFSDPPYSGYVVELHCIDSSGVDRR